MTDTTEAPAPSAAPVATDAQDVAHDVERDTHHALSRLEEGFLAEWDKLFTGMHGDAKKLLAWVASKV